MKKLIVGIFLGCVIVFASSFDAKNDTPYDNQYDYLLEPSAPIVGDSIADERAKYVAEVMETIKGKEKMAADSVFKNIKMFKNMPAERILMIMDKGWGNALGVSCTHCHNPNDWSSEEKKEKQLARDMGAMTGKINNDLLKKIEGLEKSNINCNTCHRGQKKPGGGRPSGQGAPGGPPPPKKD